MPCLLYAVDDQQTRDAETNETKRDIRLRISLHHPISLRRDMHIRQMCYNLNKSRIAKSFRPGEKSGQDRIYEPSEN